MQPVVDRSGWTGALILFASITAFAVALGLGIVAFDPITVAAILTMLGGLGILLAAEHRRG